MNRREFTKNLSMLFLEMAADGEQPIIDYVLRSTEEQQRLFAAGLSKCDGVEKKSAHQSAMAADLYLVHNAENGTPVVDFDWNAEKALRWHKRWEELGGRPMIEWDKGHFDGRSL